MASNTALQTYVAGRSMRTRQRVLTNTQKGVLVVGLPCGSFQEVLVTVPAIGDESPAHLMRRLRDFLGAQPHLEIVRQAVFGLAPVAERRRLRDTKPVNARWPVTWVEQGNGDGHPMAGVQVHAVCGVPVKLLRLSGRTLGTLYEDALARYCVLGGVCPGSANTSRAKQARETLELMEAALDLAGMKFENVYRTWFYLDDILDWYEEFNQVRNAFFQQRKIYDGLVPASTGVGGSNTVGTALVADLMAIESKDARVVLKAVASPRQCPALHYGSSFNRAVELILPGQLRLYVSGTASIGPDGQTAHVGDVNRQVELTMDVVSTILRSRRMGWCDVTRAIGYFKHAEDAPAFSRYCARHRIHRMPVVIAKNDICRDDLLFEIEVDAARLFAAGSKPDRA